MRFTLGFLLLLSMAACGPKTAVTSTGTPPLQTSGTQNGANGVGTGSWTQANVQALDAACMSTFAQYGQDAADAECSCFEPEVELTYTPQQIFGSGAQPQLGGVMQACASQIGLSI